MHSYDRVLISPDAAVPTESDVQPLREFFQSSHGPASERGDEDAAAAESGFWKRGRNDTARLDERERGSQRAPAEAISKEVSMDMRTRKVDQRNRQSIAEVKTQKREC